MRTIRPLRDKRTSDTAQEALVLYLNEQGRVDLDFIAAACRKTVEGVRDELRCRSGSEAGENIRDFQEILNQPCGVCSAPKPRCHRQRSRGSIRNSKLNMRSGARRSWLTRPFIYIWADGIYLKAGVGTERACVLVVIGVASDGTKHFLALEEGYRESKESWLGVLRSLRDRGMAAPALAVADGGLRFWAALPEVWSETQGQRCWFHKAGNILDKLPHGERAEAAKGLRAIYMAQNRRTAEGLARQLAREWHRFDTKAAECLMKDLSAKPTTTAWASRTTLVFG